MCDGMTPTTHLDTNGLLGYPAAARLLIINADDFGMSHAGNDATIRSLTEGVVTSATLMIPCPWAGHAMHFLRRHPEIAFGVHLTLVCDFDIYRWGPISSRDNVPSLIDDAGYFRSPSKIPELMQTARIEEVEQEFRAQIEAVLVAALTPTHLDWHCLAGGGRPDIFDLTLKLGREYGLAMRAHDPAEARSLNRLGLPAVDKGVLDSYRLDPAEKQIRFVQLLRELPPGLSEWAVHPSLGTDEAKTLEPHTWQVRRADYDFLVSRQARETIQREGIELIDYRLLQGVWSGPPATDA